METLKIEKAFINDETDIVSGIQKAYEKYIVRIGKKPQPMLENYLQLIEDGDVFCGKYKDKIAGVLVISILKDYLLIDNVAVFPEFQGSGFGKTLIEFSESLAFENGYKEIRLFTNEKMTENIGIYNKLGYYEYDRKEDEGYNRVYFKKKLI